MNSYSFREIGRQLVSSKTFLVMRLCLLLLFCSIVQVLAFSTYSQKTTVTLKLKNTPLEVVLNEIEEQTEFRFLYNKEQVNVDRMVDIDVLQKDILNILNELFEGEFVSYSIRDRQIVLSKQNLPQQSTKQISGIITDENGEPIIGANVSVKGTTNGTITDLEGAFSLTNVTTSSLIVITYVGYITQEHPVGNKEVINITLKEDSKLIEEVVVVGYGVQRKVTVTGAITNVGGETLNQSPSQSVSNSLSGRLSGVIASNRSGEPGNDISNILIRGKGTLGATSPLIVIDGVWGRDGFNQLDPNDVETVTVLKDASAAIYGAQAANGVVLVTTKRGESKKPTINYTANIALTQPTRLPEMANSAEYAAVYNDLLNLQGQPDKFSPEEILKFQQGTDPINYPNTDWIEETIKDFSTQHQHSLSLRGGNERVKYYVSGNFSNQNSVVKNGINDYKKFGVRSNIDAKVTDNVKVGLDLSILQSDKTVPGPGSGIIFQSMIRNYPFLIARYPNGMLGAGIERGENPLAMAREDAGYLKTKTNLYQTTFNFDISIPKVEGLGIDGFAAYDVSNEFVKSWYTPWTVYNYDSKTDTYETKLGGSVAKPQLTEEFLYDNRLTLNAKVKYNRTFDKHSLNSFLAVEQTLQKSNNFKAFRKNYLTNVIDQLFAGDEKDQSTDGKAAETARRNLFGRVSYSYSDIYLFDFNFRYDGSSNFPKNRRWGFFPGVSLGWRASEEKFISDNIDAIDNLKLRASWGKMGNDQVDAFQYLSSYTFTGGYYLGANSDPAKGVVRGLSPNPYITWEVANMINLGLDLTLWNGLFGVTADVFKQKRENILTERNASIPLYTGLKLPDENIGTVENKGFELELSHFNTKMDWQYSITGNISYSKNKIVDIDEAANAQVWQMRTGHPMGTELYYVDMGIYRSQEEIDSTPHPIGTKVGDLRYKDINGDGEIDNKDRVRLDKTNTPEIVYGLNLSAGNKAFDISMLIQGQARAWQYIYLQSGLQGNTFRDLALNRYTESNPNSKYPHLTSYETEISGYRSTFWLKNAGFIRLKSVEVGYTFPKKLVSQLNIENLRLYISGFNLITLDKLKWFDPEGSSETGAFYPQNRIYNIGLSLTF